jgi:uncharacterized lipoprotein YddW (UPF0748 family)
MIINFFKNILFKLILIALIFSSLIYPQQTAKTKAVWVTTNYRLDWPTVINNEESQKAELEEIFDNILSQNLNTVYFQIRSSGTVLFKSEHESFAPYFSGENNSSPNYNPAKFAVELAHKKGLKIHAWVNMIRCYSRNGHREYLDANHLINKHPGWIVEYKEGNNLSYWLDPGLPEVRKYLITLISEIITNYDFDGIQFDFIRYPGKYFDDDFSFYAYSEGKNRSDWRRNNINKLLAEANSAIRNIKPEVEIGASPVGIYKNSKGFYALQGYHDVYQDSHYWLQNNLVDYLVPQIYWGLNNNPDFISVAGEWLSNSYGKKIILGIGAFKPEVIKDLEKIISHSQNSNSAGFALFRYGDIKGLKLYRQIDD